MATWRFDGLSVVGAEVAEVTARAKLPDDLAFDEYTQIVEDLQLAVSFAGYLSADTARWDDAGLPETIVRRVQYGSDLMIVLLIVSGSLGGLYTVSRILKNVAEAGLVNEQRLELRDERRKRNREGESVLDGAFQAVNSGLREEHKSIDGMTYGQMTRLINAVARLGRYRVRIHIERAQDPARD